jgi:3-oxoacyl-[acyl-carrier protein] reductase
MLNLLGKTAVVTVASRGIGRSSALALAQQGTQVLVHYGRGRAEAESVIAEILAEVVASDLVCWTRKEGGRTLTAETAALC